MLRRSSALAAVALAALAAAPAALPQSDSLQDRRQAIDSRISSLRDQIAGAQEEEGVLSAQIEAATADIESLEGDIGVLASRVADLEAKLARFRERLARLEDRYREQTRHLNRLIDDHAIAQRRLEERVIELYESEPADAVEILLQVQSLAEAIEQIDFVNDIGREDERIAEQLRRLKIAMREAREKTAAIKEEVAEATAALAETTEEAQAAHAELVARQEALAAARSDRRALLADVRVGRHQDERNLAELEASASQLTAQIQAAQASSSGGSPFTGSSGGADTTPSSSGLIWPVSGSVTSGYGSRWGRMHYGIDISAPEGTPVRAAASGVVIFAGWMGGYGNLVVIDHGGGLATAYAHLSAIWIGGGSVSQGQGIGAVGCTGSCTGPHLHFEVRVNGSPVDPLGYL